MTTNPLPTEKFGLLNLWQLIGGAFWGALAGSVLWMSVNQMVRINGVGWLARQGWPLNSWALATGIGTVVGVVWEIVRQRYEQSRRAELVQVSDQLGFTFQPAPRDLELPPLRVFEDRVGLTNHMSFVDQEVAYDVFDLSTTTKSDDSPSVIRRTVVLTKIPDLPEFCLTALVGLGRIHRWSYQAVSFDSTAFEDVSQRAIVERFNRSYVLELEDAPSRNSQQHKSPQPSPKEGATESEPTMEATREEAVRDRFRLGLLEALADRPGWSMESSAGHLAFWRGAQEWSGPQQVGYLAQAVTLRSELVKVPGTNALNGTLVPSEPEDVRRRKAARLAMQMLGGIFGLFGGFFIGGGVATYFFFGRKGAPGAPLEMICPFLGGALGVAIGVAVGTALRWLVPAMPPKAGKSVDWRIAGLMMAGVFVGFFGGAISGAVVGEAIANGDHSLIGLCFFAGAGVGIFLLPMAMFTLGIWMFAERVPAGANASGST